MWSRTALRPLRLLRHRPLSTTTPQTDVQFPKQARVVVIGGGIIGNSVAYHLVRHQGFQDVVLLERDKITSGTTWHAAGLIVSFGSTSETSTDIRKYTKALYGRLEAETGQATGLNLCGFIELATNEDRLEEFRRVAAFNRICGVDVHEISPKQVKDLFPLCKVDDVIAGFYVPNDGRVNPVDVTMALSKGAKMKGANIIEGVPVTGILQKNGRVTGVRTARGDIQAEYVVNCAGMWARELGEKAGVTIPLQAAEHYYLITDPMPEVDRAWPVIEDPSAYTYIRPEGGGLMVGLFEPKAAAWNVGGIPKDFSFGSITPDWERMGPYVETAMGRVPATLKAGCKTFFCGPESFTPDLRPVVGEAPELKNFFVAAGLNSVGILSGGGLGRVLAHWIVNGKPDVDCTGFNMDRLHKWQTNPEYRRHRTEESLGMVYKCHYPSYAMSTARYVKRSPFHDRLAVQGAYFREVSGWESPGWYAPKGVEPKITKYTWGRENFWDYWAAEHKAAREGVIVMDMSFMGKFLVQGRDAGKVLNYISANNVDGECNMITYTQWLNNDGKMEADVTVIKMTETKYMVIVTDTMTRHVETWIQRNTPTDAHVTVTDVTSGYGQINVQGPKSRALMQAVTDTDMSNEGFPFRASRDIAIGYGRCQCTRITYLGELGYELCIPSDMAAHVYDRIVEAGKQFDLKHCGLKALGSLRMEKAYRDYGHDMDNTDTILEVGLGFAVDYHKPGGFLGKDAVVAQKNKKVLEKRLVQVLVKDPKPMLVHAEPLLRNGKPVGYVRAASYGHTLGGAVGLALVEAKENVTKSYLEDAKWEVNIAGTIYPAAVSLRPMYDPENARIRC